MPSRIFTSIIMALILGDLTGACLKREIPKRLNEIKPIQPSVTVMTPDLINNITYTNITNGTTGLPSVIIILNCTSKNDSVLYNKCVNGGYCQYELMPDFSKTSYCNCPDGFDGSQCAKRYRAPSMASLYAAVGVSAIVFIVVMVGLACVIRIRKNRSRGVQMGRSESPRSPPPVGNSRSTVNTPQHFSLYSSPSHNGDASAAPEESIELLEQGNGHVDEQPPPYNPA